MGKTVLFKPDSKGIQEICKSDGMCSELLDHAVKVAQAANTDAERQTEALHISSWQKPPYAAQVDELTYTAVGVAKTTNRLAGYNELKHKSLSNQLFGGVFK